MAIIKNSKSNMTLASEGVTREQVEALVADIKKTSYKYMGMNDSNYPVKGYKLSTVLPICMKLKKIPKGVERRLTKLGFSL